MNSYTLIIDNANDDFIKGIKSLAKAVNIKVKVKREKNLTINGFTPKFESELLQELEDTKQAYSHGKSVTFNSVADFRKAINSGKI
ncbi:hypothetical protein CFT13S00388_09395 [Campylobacter fetus subsp. testudinum]|uniref:hypothetical protein n=1 Tax=Campylobacter fetus TaxID=196 RepID=UPI000818C257|nr:hypothetical protein [Campylobacter fetus]OCR85793.1 hypothetical protein CFT13S00388_09400 [Campylobacter fetus subsp. testudinum]OCR85796.1 hypothetical protein CFT13S00388_09395 [Campylobacter fetus subsp. testudinum]